MNERVVDRLREAAADENRPDLILSNVFRLAARIAGRDARQLRRHFVEAEEAQHFFGEIHFFVNVTAIRWDDHIESVTRWTCVEAEAAEELEGVADADCTGR